MLHATLDQIHGATAPGGTFVGNYPQSPRKAADVDRHVIQTALQDRYEDVSYESKRNLFVAKRPK